MLEEIMFIVVTILLGAYLICMLRTKEDKEEWFSDEEEKKRKWFKW